MIVWIAGIFLLAMTLFDLKKKKIPAVIGTTGILACATIILWKNPATLLIGILGFIFAYLLYEFNIFSGIADIKATILVSLTLVSLYEFLFFMVFLAVINLIYQGSLKYILKVKHKEDIPLLPVFLLVWAVMLFI